MLRWQHTDQRDLPYSPHAGPVALVASTETVLRGLKSADAAGDILRPVEQARHDRLLRRADRDDFLAARVLVRALLDGYGHPSATLVQLCPGCGSTEHGRPSLLNTPQVAVSWSHARGFVAAAVAPTRCEPAGRFGAVGVDIEPVQEQPPPIPVDGSDHSPVLHRWCGWTRAEAIVKYGATDLDTALRWRLSGPPRPDGTSPPQTPVVLTDRAGPNWLVSVAADAVARIGYLAASDGGPVTIDW